jgi:predicted PurR-regulated permease PerM
LIPLAIALLLTFLLAPAVQRLQQLGLPRAPAVMITAILSFALIGVIIWLIIAQTFGLVASLPEYRNNIQTKIVSVQKNLGLGLQKTAGPIEDFIKDVEKLLLPKLDNRKSIPVEVVKPPENIFHVVRTALISLLKPLGTALVIIIFVIFMLLKHDDLKDRLFRMMGTGHLHVTMEALDEAGRRVSRYLLLQLLVNGSQGIVVTGCLFFIGLPNAILWGFLTAVLRFIPYLGPWIAAGLPIVLSVAVFNNWIPTLLVISLFVVLEILTIYVVEPWVYGSHTGVSPFALIVALVYWTSIWGIAGLLLSTPLTVCLVVIGKCVPELKFLNIMLGDEPGLDPQSRFYQRLVAGNREEADEIADDFWKEKDVLTMYDELLIPTLIFAERDLEEGSLSEERHTSILESVREIAEESAEHFDKKTDTESLPAGTDLKLLCLPARTKSDEISAMMFTRLSEKLSNVEVRYLSATSLMGEMLNQVKEINPDIICVCSLPPSAVSKARYSLKKIRVSFPDLQVLVGLWQSNNGVEKVMERLESAGKGTQQIVSNLREGLNQIEQFQLSKAATADVA